MEKILLALGMIFLFVIILVLILRSAVKKADARVLKEIQKSERRTIVEKIYVDENTNISPKGRNPGFLKKLIERSEEPYDEIGTLQVGENPHIEVSYWLDSKSSGGYKVTRIARLSRAGVIMFFDE